MSPTKHTSAAMGGTKPALVPKLRFPEFRETEGWENSPLGELMEITSSKRVHESEWTVSGVPFYRAREIVALNNMDPISPLYISEELYRENAKRSGEIVEGDLLVTGVGSIGIPYLVKGNDRFYFKDGNIIWLKNRGAKLLGRFLHLLYGTQFVQSQIKTMAGVGTVGTYTIDNANRTSVVFPTDKAEQQKIAECLSSVDELLAAQARKVDALKTHKKGLMQQLFPREGETQPRLRFPEFQNAAEWSSLPLGDLGEIITGKTPNTKEADLWGGDILFITPTDISEEDKYQRTTARTVIETKSTKILPAGSIVYTCIASIGKMALTVHPSITNQQINAVVPNEKTLEEFIYYALVNLTPWIKTLPATNTLPIINKSDFSKIAILFPEDKAEQHRIASCLSSLDALITAETQKLETLKAHKRGLMQQLFPSPEETADL